MARAEVIVRADAEEALRLDEDTLDPKKHYRFLQDRRENIAKKLSMGYELVLRSETGVRLLHESPDAKTADDHIRVGDSVLAMIDKTRYNERRRQVQALTDSRLGAKEKSFKEQGRRRGVRTLTGDEGE